MTTRRDLLRLFVGTAGCAILSACTGVDGLPAVPTGPGDTFSFPQGVASADPQVDGFILWTRVAGAEGDVDLMVEIAEDADFATVLTRKAVTAPAQYLNTVRVLVTDLPSGQWFHYRFIAPDGSVSRTGRTRTAPDAASEKPANIAVFSCQNYEQGYFSAYRAMMEEDAAARPERKVDLVLHVGDFVYENVREEDTKGWHDLNWNDPRLMNADGSLRRVGGYPSGGQPGAFDYKGPKTLEDYRHLYLAYLSDPDLQAARAAYPFVQTWDDHEIYNDVWQSFTEDRSIDELRLAGNQAWFEFVPAALSLSDAGSDHHAHDFVPAEAAAMPAEPVGEDFLIENDGNLAAIGSLTIYRSLRWGCLFELFLVDGRSYRGPPPDVPAFRMARIMARQFATLPTELIAELDAGRTANGGAPREKLSYLGVEFDNPRRDLPANSMLGGRQRDWLLGRLEASDAQWKLLGLNVGLMRHAFDDSFSPKGQKNGLYWLDGWDGFPGERTQLTTAFRARGFGNLVSLTGDRHMHMAGYVFEDFDSSDQRPVAVEFCGAAISAPNRLAIMAGITRRDPSYAGYFFHQGNPEVGENLIRPSMDQLMLHGHESARLCSEGAPAEDMLGAADPAVNPHLQYVDSDAFGYMIAHVTPGDVEVQQVTIAEPVSLPGEAVPILRRVALSVAAWVGNEQPDLRTVQASGADVDLKLK